MQGEDIASMGCLYSLRIERLDGLYLWHKGEWHPKVNQTDVRLNSVRAYLENRHCEFYSLTTVGELNLQYCR